MMTGAQLVSQRCLGSLLGVRHILDGLIDRGE
jgi:hypothetical protein